MKNLKNLLRWCGKIELKVEIDSWFYIKKYLKFIENAKLEEKVCPNLTRAEGQVFGIGCKIFTIAGPVILYGVLASWVLGVIYWGGRVMGFFDKQIEK